MIDSGDDLRWYREKRPEYDELAERVSKILIEVLNIEKINYALIQSRSKSIDSFQNRLKEIQHSGKDLVDLAGIRVVGYVRSDTDKIIQTIRDNFDVDENKSKDKSALLSPDRFGYRAIHLVCTLPNERIVLPEYKKFKDMVFEIQIKTILEHAWAQIEHDRNYKYKALPKNIQRDFYLIAGSLEMADEKFDQISKRIEEYGEEVKLKTEEGKLKEIPIDPLTLKRFLIDHFSQQLEIEEYYSHDKSGQKEVEELAEMGINNMAQLEDSTLPHLVEIEQKYWELSSENVHKLALTGLIFVILITKFGEKYFETARKRRGFEQDDFLYRMKYYQDAIKFVKQKYS